MEATGVALVTGASGGLGAAIALDLDAAGYNVAVHFRAAEQRAAAVVERFRQVGMTVQADVSDWDETNAMHEKVAAELGPVDVLVNTAGMRADGLMAGQGPAEWKRVIDVNLLGTFHTCRAVVPQMLRRRSGWIVNVVSPAGLRGSPGQTAYSASKAGVVGLTRSLAHECARRKVMVNALSPGYMETTMTRDLPEDAKRRILDAIPAGRITTVEEVAAATRLIIGTPYMTGQVVSIDGGMSA